MSGIAKVTVYKT